MAESQSFLGRLLTRRRAPRDAVELPPRAEGSDEPRPVARSRPRFPQNSADFFSGSSGAILHDTSFTHVNGPQIQYHMNYLTPHSDHGQLQALRPSPEISATTSQPGETVTETQHATTTSTANPEADFHQSPHPLSNITRLEYRPDKGNKIYERHLALKQRGFPLWIPEPNMQLPAPYRRIGISIGDVGTITPSGGFSFLFNVCQPHNHPVNLWGLPDGFVPIELKPADVYEFQDLTPGSYLASATIEKVQNNPPFTGMTFRTSAAEGAVLTAPEGSIAMDLHTTRRFQAYAEANVESWYRYVNGTRGIDAKNGELRLVVGCDKATSYGTAVISNISQQRINYLKFRVVDGHAMPSERPSGLVPLYRWESSGLLESRVGPDPTQIAELREDDASNIPTGGNYRNLCIFVRTLNMRLKDEIFAAMADEIEAAEKQQNKFGTHGSTFRIDPSVNSLKRLGTWISDTTEGVIPGEDLQEITALGENVTLTMSASAIKHHPADSINKRLLEKASNRCRVAITHDEDWYSVLNEDDVVVPTPDELTKRVLAAHHITEKDGIVYLTPTREHSILKNTQYSRRPKAKPLEQTPSPRNAIVLPHILGLGRQREDNMKAMNAQYFERTVTEQGGPPMQKKALLIGIQQVPSPDEENGKKKRFSKRKSRQAPKAPPAHRDVEVMQKLLIRLYAYNPEDVTILINDNSHSPDIQPTRENVLQAIGNLVENAAEHSRFFFYYCNHSVQKHDEHAEEDRSNDSIVTSDGKTINDDELRVNLTASLPQSSSLIAVLDSSHSETPLNLKHFRCNSVYVPWIDTSWHAQTSSEVDTFAGKNKKSMRPHTVREPKHSQWRDPTISDKQADLAQHHRSPFASANVSAKPVPGFDLLVEDTPVEMYCTGDCRDNDLYTGEDAPKADVILLSWSRGAQMMQNDASVSCTIAQALSPILNGKHPSYQDLLTLVSHNIYASYVNLSPRVYHRSNVRATEIAMKNAPGEQAQQSSSAEEGGFQNPRLYSDRPLEMGRVFYP